jgi:predicted DNA-binding protein
VLKHKDHLAKGGENVGVKAFSLRLPEPEYEALKAMSVATGTSMNSLVTQAIRSWLAEPVRQAELRGRIADVTERYALALEKLAHL